MNISEQEIWLRAYCAVLSGASHQSYRSDICIEKANEYGNQAVKDFHARFPKFQFVSNKDKSE